MAAKWPTGKYVPLNNESIKEVLHLPGFESPPLSQVSDVELPGHDAEGSQNETDDEA